MSTQLFFRDAQSDYSTGNNDAKLNGSTAGWDNRALSLTRGAGPAVGKTTDTVAGTTLGIEVGSVGGFGIPWAWLTPPLDANVTISGSITWNLWASESNMSANVAINGVLEVIDGATGATTLIDKTARTTELGTSSAAANFSETPAAGVACKRGDRLRVRVFGDDAGTMGSGFQFDFNLEGTAGVNGDSYLTLTENLTFVSEPAGTTIYPINSAGLGETVSDTGFVAGGTYENIDRGGLIDWVNPSNASASDNTYATAALIGTGSDYLVCRNLGLSLPAGSVIRGLEIEVEAVAGSGLVDVNAQFQDETGALVGTAKNGFAGFGTAEANIAVGGQDDNWGIPQLTEARVEHANFGVRLWTPDNDTTTFSVDRIRIKAYYQTQGVYESREAWTSRGAGVQTDVTNTVNGWTSPIQVTDSAGSAPVEWYTRQLAAFTLGGAVRCNIRSSLGTGNGSAKVELAVVDSNGTNPTVWALGSDTTGVGPSEAAQSFLISGADLSVSAGQRIRIRLYYDDRVGAAMTAGAITLYYAGTSGGASGDTYLTFSQTLTEFVAAERVPYYRPHTPFLVQ